MQPVDPTQAPTTKKYVGVEKNIRESTKDGILHIYGTGPDGKQFQESTHTKNKTEARKILRDRMGKVDRGEAVARIDLLTDAVVEEYLAVIASQVAAEERSQRTHDLYRQRYDKHVAPVIGRKRIQDVRPEHVGKIFATQREAGLAPLTIHGTMTLISGIFAFALTRGYVAMNPLDRLSKLEKPSQKVRKKSTRLSDSGVRSLCDSATDHFRPITIMLAWSGLRVSEALGLRWEDIDSDEIRVRYQLAEDDTLRALKTEAARRSVPKLPVIAEMLREHRQRQFARGFAGSGDIVFTTKDGRPLDRHNVRKAIVNAAEKAGLEGITTHDLRRTYISHLILGLGLDPVRVAKIAGHSNVSVTLNTYAEEFDKAMHRDDLMQRIEQAGFGAVAS
jgi:integrase